MMRRSLQGSPDLDEVREAIGLHRAGPGVRPFRLAGSGPEARVPRSDLVLPEGQPATSLNRELRQLIGSVTAMSSGVALTHQALAGALAGAHGTFPWGFVAMLLAWPMPLIQPILAGIGALTLCAIGIITRSWQDLRPGQKWPLAAGIIAAVLGAAPMVLACTLIVIAFVLFVTAALLILFYFFDRLLR